jgi:hypothetical protein
MADEVVYVLGTPGSNTVKIGRTTNLAKRLADIQRMSPVPLSVLWSTPGGHELETRLHRHFATHRSHGEWFTFEADPVRAIKEAVEMEPWAQANSCSEQRISREPRVLPKPDPEIIALIAELKEIPDTVERVRKVMALREAIAHSQARLLSEQRTALSQLKASGHSWRALGEMFGISGARAEAIVNPKAKRQRA